MLPNKHDGPSDDHLGASQPFALMGGESGCRAARERDEPQNMPDTSTPGPDPGNARISASRPQFCGPPRVLRCPAGATSTAELRDSGVRDPPCDHRHEGVPRRRWAPGALSVLTVAAVTGLTPASSSASSHREAPLIAGDPMADNIEAFAFTSPDKPDTVTLVANWLSIQKRNGGDRTCTRPPRTPATTSRSLRTASASRTHGHEPAA